MTNSNNILNLLKINIKLLQIRLKRIICKIISGEAAFSGGHWLLLFGCHLIFIVISMLPFPCLFIMIIWDCSPYVAQQGHSRRLLATHVPGITIHPRVQPIDPGCFEVLKCCCTDSVSEVKLNFQR